MSKRKTFQVVLEVPLLNGDKEKYTSHPEETDLSNNYIINKKIPLNWMKFT